MVSVEPAGFALIAADSSTRRSVPARIRSGDRN